MGVYAKADHVVFTLNKPEFDRFMQFVFRNYPGVANWSLMSEFAGWRVVNVPNWVGNTADFYRLVHVK